MDLKITTIKGKHLNFPKNIILGWPLIFDTQINKFEKYWFFGLIKIVLCNGYTYIFYVLIKIYGFLYNFYQKN